MPTMQESAFSILAISKITALETGLPVSDRDDRGIVSGYLPRSESLGKLQRGFKCGELNGQIKPGDTVAIFGAGSIGLAILLTALFYFPAVVIMVDSDDNRLKVARMVGATHGINNGVGNTAEEIMALTANRGVDLVIDAADLPDNSSLCHGIITTGGHIANVRKQGKSFQLRLDTP